MPAVFTVATEELLFLLELELVAGLEDEFVVEEEPDVTLLDVLLEKVIEDDVGFDVSGVSFFEEDVLDDTLDEALEDVAELTSVFVSVYFSVSVVASFSVVVSFSVSVSVLEDSVSLS